MVIITIRAYIKIQKLRKSYTGSRKPGADFYEKLSKMDKPFAKLKEKEKKLKYLKPEMKGN